MGRVLIMFYWIWLAGALAVLLYRIQGRVSGRRSRVFEFRSAPPGEDEAVAPAADREPGSRSAPATTPSAGAAEPADLDAHDTGEIHPAVLSAMRAEPTETTTDAPTGLFGAEPDDPALRTRTLAPLRETLIGIEMPCELVPVTELGPCRPADVHRERLVMATTTAGAGELAARLADELRRIGLDVTPIDAHICVARRRDHALELRVHEFPDRVHVGPAAAFPTVPDGAVVAEFLAA